MTVRPILFDSAPNSREGVGKRGQTVRDRPEGSTRLYLIIPDYT